MEKIRQDFQSRSIPSHEYNSGGTSIQVNAREFSPLKESDNKQRALVLFLGWGPDENASSYDELSKSLADSFGCRVFLVNTRPEKLVKDSLYHEAEATYQFLKDMDITNTILAGYSQGGAKAANLAVISQQDSTIKPEALILLAPVGINAQTPAHLAATFALDTVNQQFPQFIKDKRYIRKPSKKYPNLGNTKQIQSDVVRGVVGEITKSKLDYLGRLATEVKQMSKTNPNLEELRIPVILMQGKYDKPFGPKGGLANEQMAEQDKEGLVNKTLKTIFPNSPYINRILVTGQGNHIFPLIRSEQIAKVASYLVKRQNRQKVEF